MDALTIRNARAEDLPAIARIYQNAIRHSARSHYRPEQLEAWIGDYDAKLKNFVTRYLALVAEAGSGIVGFVTLEPEIGRVRACYVKPGFAGRSVGGRLLEVLEEQARGLGLARLTLDASLNAAGFYRKQGYIQAGPGYRVTLDNDVELEGIPMEKPLQS